MLNLWFQFLVGCLHHSNIVYYHFADVACFLSHIDSGLPQVVWASHTTRDAYFTVSYSPFQIAKLYIRIVFQTKKFWCVFFFFTKTFVVALNNIFLLQQYLWVPVPVFLFWFSVSHLLKQYRRLLFHQGPVSQSIVSLTSSLRVISLTVLADSVYNILIFFAEKISAYLRITRCKF